MDNDLHSFCGKVAAEVTRLHPEVRGQRTEDGGRRTEDRDQRSEVRGQRSEVRSARTESGWPNVALLALLGTPSRSRLCLQ
ncbi:MAG: hypothetical protein C5B50_15025 [Verrucomicrobia bacterium]|nr:MAG: hypothetical protein C5B50_15025 [Verrucomicrobiota bacterium]